VVEAKNKMLGGRKDQSREFACSPNSRPKLAARVKADDYSSLRLLPGDDVARAMTDVAGIGELLLLPKEEIAPKVRAGYSGVEDHSKPFHNFMEHLMTVIFPVTFVAAVYLSIIHLHGFGLIWLIALAVPVSWALSDLVTGIVHWAADNYGTEQTPLVGHSLIKPFRMHHVYPRDICTHNLVITIGNTCILAVPALAACLYILWDGPVSWQRALIIFVAVVTVGSTVATNQFHKWAHQENPSAVVRWFQQMRVVLKPSQHELHHTLPYNKHYCITNGWLNPVLEKIKFFRGLECLLRRAGLNPIDASATK